MFKDSFRNELDKIKPSETTKKEILEKLAEQSAKDKGFNKINGRKFWLSAVAAALCISVLAISIFWDKRPNISTELTPAVPEAAAIETVTYKDIYTLFENLYDEENRGNKGSAWNNIFYGVTDYAEDEDAIDIGGDLKSEADFDAKPDNANGALNTQSKDDYSSTNVQVEGVDEGDIVKTDGKYIYVHKDYERKIIIAKAENGKLGLTAEISYGQKGQKKEGFLDMYVKGNRLILITSEISYTTKSYYPSSRIIARIYDITVPSKAEVLKVFTQSGRYVSSRLSGPNLFVFTTEVFYGKPDENDPTTFVPFVGEDYNERAVAEDNICAFSGEVDRSYFTASSIDIETAERVGEKSVLGGGDEVFVNNSSIYAAAIITENKENKENKITTYEVNTSLIRFTIDGGKLSYSASGKVKGRILNQFSMDEYNGYFRIVTTTESLVYKNKYGDDRDMAYSYQLPEEKKANALFVLDLNLKTVGSITDLAKDEQVYSVRFSGDIGYFVTFRQVDPLFTVDLSNPKEPKVLSALKIPGFSNYLHPYGNGLLLGIGKNADEKTGSVGTAKFSMFDVSDPKNVTEESVYDLKFSNVSAEYNHKAVLVSVGKNLIGLAGYDYISDKYCLYKYENKQFKKLAEFKIGDYADNMYDVRGIYIGEYFYLCGNRGIVSYTLDGFKETAKLLF